MKTATSVKDKLKYRAQKEGRIVQDVFTVYVLERVLYRLSVSRYVDFFTLKGGILLYSLFSEDYTRATTDIDFLAKGITNDADQIRTIFERILKIKCDDTIRFDMDSLNVANITEFKEYHGVRVTVMAYLDRTRIPVNIDIGYGDIVYPEKRRMEYPTILDDEVPILYAYSLESIIAEKFEAIVSLGKVNSRYKDFYDICVLIEKFDFDGKNIKEAVSETFRNRGTTFDIIAAFEDGFADDIYRKGRWKGFLKSKHVNRDMTLEEAIEKIKAFMAPAIDAIEGDKDFKKKWDHEKQIWTSGKK